MNNYEKIKNMGIEDMATMLKTEQCKECGYCASCWEDCEAEDCWNFTNEHYKQFLQQEAE